MKATVAVIGGGPAGSTLGTLIKRYAPNTDVLILERESFPRDHVGESQLPNVCAVLAEMGVWDKIERAGFPIKIGATYRWGRTDDLWDFEFYPAHRFADEPRPAKYEGQRTQTAFQVDRAIYDKILLDHAKELGCRVLEQTKVAAIERDGDRVCGLTLESGETVEAKFYVDASGNSGILRRAMEVEVDEPTSLRNVAFWEYWRNAEWAVTVGKGATKVQVMSLGYGWLWFIPLGPDRTSVGLVCPAEYAKSCGKRPQDLYREAVASDPRIGPLMQGAASEGKFYSTKDWSFVAERLAGENWFLCGECAGFADPILAAGLTLAQTGARHLAYTIIALERGKLAPDWLRRHYDETQRKRIGQHIRFADFWYTANGVFTDVKEHTSRIAADTGLELEPDLAFQWLGTGGFMNDNPFFASIGEYNITAIKQVMQMFLGKPSEWAIGQNNVFKLNLEGAKRGFVPILHEGRIIQEPCWEREGRILPGVGIFKILTDILSTEHRAEFINRELQSRMVGLFPDPAQSVDAALQCLEAMIQEGWVVASHHPKMPLLPYRTGEETEGMHRNWDGALPNVTVAAALRSASQFTEFVVPS